LSPTAETFSPSDRLCDRKTAANSKLAALEVFMAEESVEEKLARLEAENKALKDQVERKPGQLRLKISEKGGMSVYGLGRFPVTLYKEQWSRLLDHTDEIRAFLKDNDQQLKAKQ
jgi:hypothetical protein